jgi:hypothetical protein
MAACGGDDDSATPTGGSSTPTSSAALSGTPITTPAGSEGAPAVCTQEDAQKGTITTLAFGDDKTNYDPGQPIEMTFTIANCGDVETTLTFPTTERYVFNALDAAGNKVWSTEDGKVFNEIQGTEKIGVNKTIVYTETWDQKDSNGQQVPDGQYKIQAFSVGCTSGQTGCHFGPVRFVLIGPIPSATG